MHKDWNKTKLGLDPSVGGEPHVEIDESKIIGNANKIFWMFGIIDRATKECRVFTVLDNRTKETLLSLVIKNVATCDDIIHMNNRSKTYLHKYCFSTRVYSDCWRAYNTTDFKNKGSYLHRVNHSIWWGSGLFNTNTIEGLWSQLKRISNYFSGVNFNVLNNLEEKDVYVRDYLDGWVCMAIFFRNCEIKKLSIINKTKSLCHYLKY